MSEITGYSSEELLNLNIFDLMRQDDVPYAKDLYTKMLDGNLEVARSMPILRKDKSLVYCDVSFKLMKISNQTYFVGFLRDVTEQKIAEDKLRESEQRFRHLLFNAPEAIWVQDIGGTFIDGNKMAEELTGYSREELLGKNMLELGLIPPEYIPKVMDAFQDISIGNRSGPVEMILQRNDGSNIFVEASIIPVEREGKVEIIGVVLDVTERKKAQEAITKANQLLKRSNEELESYTYVVSHDLKAPLRTIRSFGSFILEDYSDKLDETGKDYLNRMVNASSHLDSMIEDLLVLSRVGRKFTEFEKINLNKLVDEILADLETSIKDSKAKITVDKLPVLSLQRVWIKQLFMNLLSNALKFNESKTPKIEIKYEEKSNEHQFTVKDNGIGIEKKYLPRIFSLFERAPTEKKYDGTGAGLAICKKIVEKFGGKIWVESTIGKGSSFFFTISKELKQENGR
jgi:PAS domain S-box-containing protein